MAERTLVHAEDVLGCGRSNMDPDGLVEEDCGTIVVVVGVVLGASREFQLCTSAKAFWLRWVTGEAER